jgi:hypothetical protein
MEPCTQKERIERLEGAVDKIGGEVSGIASNVAIIKSRIEPLMDMVQSHDRSLRGNNGDAGLVSKVSTACNILDEFNYALKGDRKEPGLISDIKNLQTWMAEIKDERIWLTRLVVGVIFIEVVGLAFLFFR